MRVLDVNFEQELIELGVGSRFASKIAGKQRVTARVEFTDDELSAYTRVKAGSWWEDVILIPKIWHDHYCLHNLRIKAANRHFESNLWEAECEVDYVTERVAVSDNSFLGIEAQKFEVEHG